MKMTWLKSIMPKEDRFFDLFERHARTLVEGAKALERLLGGNGGVMRCCEDIARHELAADEITRETMLAVRRSFITPFDRSDIQALTTSLDDAIDQMQKTAKKTVLFEIASFEPGMREMGGIIVRTATINDQAVPLLRSIGKNATQLNQLTEEIIVLEGRADDVHEKGLKALLTNSRADPMGFIMNSEIYDHLEKVMDRFEDVAKCISSIVVEHH